MSKYRTRRTSKRGVNMFTTSLAAHAAYAAPAEPRTRRQRQHPLSSTRPHARRSTLVVAAPAAASAAPIHALESRRALAESRASRRRTTVAHGLPIPIIGGLFNAPIMTIIYVFVAVKMYLGYDRTTFGNGVPKVLMVGLWPVLSILSASFRENLKRSM